MIITGIIFVCIFHMRCILLQGLYILEASRFFLGNLLLLLLLFCCYCYYWVRFLLHGSWNC